MPEISRFYGLIIAMFYNDHAPPHFHVRYGSHRASVVIAPPALLSGSLPPRALGLVVEWASLHRDELLADWERARTQQQLLPVEPLEQVMMVQITAVELRGGTWLHLRFDDGSAGDVDIAELIPFEGVFAALGDTSLFEQVRVDPDWGTLCWPGDLDLAPEPLYERATGKSPWPREQPEAGMPVQG